MLQMLLLSTVRQVAAVKMARVPRIYNALITSDQELIPSQADPIVSPVLHPLPFLVLPYTSYSMFSLYPTGTKKYIHSYTAEPEERPEADNSAVIKNNTPENREIPDVPPPPLFPQKIGKKEEKKIEEFPPAPVGYAV
ncbi:uncharacterized protein LOC126903568 isoform X2 [Daktulosphaira vitifoliae]|nr:uncharacterized protein LOC126903568 isoform X2 [Daktulosphaira vitifoliae]XP_050537743.1 uncharacterized protein LOC126903568 isoform X2 [Daktulosphaira vitifoliae]XP_050537744.1 uncharacterized protein LOC126903568 isoform X2 [Daktulosphaira vitifoliae]